MGENILQKINIIPVNTRHSGESRNPVLYLSLKRKLTTWIPAFAGMTVVAGMTVLLVGLVVLGAAESAPRDPIQEFSSRVKKITLKNGLRVLMVERHTSPTVSFAMYIKTGGLDDEDGKSGLAHMFEHMLFKGTKTIGTKDYEKESKILDQMDDVQAVLQYELDLGSKAKPEKVEALKERFKQLEEEHAKYLLEEEFWKIYERAGGEGLNAATGYDYTNYVISLPSNQINLWMAMERDRIKNPVLREFYKERDVVMEERRLRVDNSPQGKLWEQFLAAAFIAHPYGRPILGWESDISRVSRRDANEFFKRHYDISRLVLAVVGDINPRELEKLLQQNFEDIPSQNLGTPSRIPIEPPQEGERRVDVLFDAEPSLLIGYHRPDLNDPDDAVFEVLADILGSGRTSRFSKEIVEKKQIGTGLWASSSGPGERAPNLFLMGGSPRSPHTSAELEKALYDEVEKIKKEGPSEHELEKVKNNAVQSLIEAIANNSGMANQLANYEAVAGDWNRLIQFIKDIQTVTQDDVKRVANKYLVKANRTVGSLVRKEK